MRTAAVGIAVALVAAVAAVAVIPAEPDAAAPDFPSPRLQDEVQFAVAGDARAVRNAALARADVWRPANPGRADLSGALQAADILARPVVRCRFQPSRVDGTTPKFRCVLENGEVIRVKYGETPEIPAELAATRLLTALGFGADRVSVVPLVRCYGCPRWTFRSMWIADRIGVRDLIAEALPGQRYTDFQWVGVERRFPGAELAVGGQEGWAWFELPGDDAPDEQRAELDALRLVARFLAHWDNKAANQRLVCLSPGNASGACAEPFAFIQDLGATFGPRKMDLDGWARTQVWDDRKTCRLTMRDLPHGGGTFVDVSVSERGRLLLARQLSALSDSQLTVLFRGARTPAVHGSGPAADAGAWVRVFKEKVTAISSGPACPS
jgi:hypothetical protein